MGGVPVWRQALLVALVGARLGAGDVSLVDDAAVPTGCFSYGYKFHPALQNISGMPFTVHSVSQCQERCRNIVGCFHFAFWLKSGECWLGDLKSKIIKAMTTGVVCGPAYCPKAPPACTEIPGPAFPASTDSQTRAAWPGGEQPTNLQCWPRLPNGFPDRCRSRMVTVLEDSKFGWPGRCDNLRKITDLRPGETCQLRCFNSALCGVWSVENISTPGVPSCWQGLKAFNCYNGGGLTPMRAQRVMHGTFRVLMNTMGMRIMNLTKAFEFSAINSHRENVKRCRKTCLSYLFCQYWQYSPVWGCWVEDPAVTPVAYPLVNNGVDMVTGVESANEIKAGEYVQRFCSDEPAVPLPTDDPISGSVAAPQSARVALKGQSGSHATLAPPASRTNREVEVEGAQQVGAADAGGMPGWAWLLIGFVLALCLAVVGIVVYITVLDADKLGTRGARGAHTSKSSRGGGGADSFRSTSSSNSETAALMRSQNGHAPAHPHMQQMQQWAQGLWHPHAQAPPPQMPATDMKLAQENGASHHHWMHWNHGAQQQGQYGQMPTQHHHGNQGWM